MLFETCHTPRKLPNTIISHTNVFLCWNIALTKDLLILLTNLRDHSSRHFSFAATQAPHEKSRKRKGVGRICGRDSHVLHNDKFLSAIRDDRIITALRSRKPTDFDYLFSYQGDRFAPTGLTITLRMATPRSWGPLTRTTPSDTQA